MKEAAPLEHDIFISYAHIDDTPLMGEEDGWISTFHKNLDALVKQIAGVSLTIWRDPNLHGNDYFSDTLLVETLPKTAVLVSVLSPGYLNSTYCLKELNAFVQAAEDAGGVRTGNKSRVFKVLKTSVPRESHPPPLDSLLGYEFFQRNADTGKLQEFRSELGPEASRNFLDKLYELAAEIVELLNTVKEVGMIGVADDAKETVFLAETTSDLSGQRDQIKAELRQLGHTVLPDNALPLETAELADVVSAALKRSKLAIHPIGSNYGLIPEGDRRSVIRLQNDLAAAQSRGDGLARLIWIPKDVNLTDERQQRFIDHLKNDAESHFGADFLNTGVEDLKTVIRDRLRGEPKHVPETMSEAELVRVYLICDQRDLETVRPLADYLYSQGLEVLLPVFEGAEEQVREDHTDKLVDSDAIIIYYGSANELWLSSKLRDLRKLPGYEGSKPKSSTAIYVTAPMNSAKELLKSREALVLKNFSEFSPPAVQPFLDAIQVADTVTEL